jgi:hypothetical protein
MNEAQMVAYSASLIFVFWMGFLGHVFTKDPEGSPLILAWIIGLVFPIMFFITALFRLVAINL